jgi:hypothetical protein
MARLRTVFLVFAAGALEISADPGEVAAQDRCFTVDTLNTCTACSEFGCTARYENGAGSAAVQDHGNGKFFDVNCSLQPEGVIGCTSASLDAVECGSGAPVEVDLQDFTDDSAPVSSPVPDCLEDVRIFVEVEYVP